MQKIVTSRQWVWKANSFDASNGVQETWIVRIFFQVAKLAQVLDEAVTNFLKYGFPSSSKMRILLKITNIADEISERWVAK